MRWRMRSWHFVFNGIRAHMVGRTIAGLGEGNGDACIAAATEGLDVFACFLESLQVSGFVFAVGGFFGGRMGHMVAAWSKWLERRVVNCEARVRRSSMETVDDGVLTMPACREAVKFMRSGLLCWYSFMC
jgi:hypothetical protein